MEKQLKDAREIAQSKIEEIKTTLNERMRDARDRIEDTRENPIGMLFAGIAVGFLIGIVLPVTRFESQRIRPIAEGVKEEVKRRGGVVIKETIDAGREAALQSFRQQTRGVTNWSGAL